MPTIPSIPYGITVLGFLSLTGQLTFRHRPARHRHRVRCGTTTPAIGGPGTKLVIDASAAIGPIGIPFIDIPTAPGFFNSTTNPTSGFFNTGAGGGSGFFNFGAGSSGLFNMVPMSIIGGLVSPAY